MAPVFSLVLDKDVSEDLALLYPELYKDLTKVGIASFLVQSASTALMTESKLILLFFRVDR